MQMQPRLNICDKLMHSLLLKIEFLNSIFLMFLAGTMFKRVFSWYAEQESPVIKLFCWYIVQESHLI